MIIHTSQSGASAVTWQTQAANRRSRLTKILEFALANTFTPGDFTINSKGGCRLNPQLAKVVAKEIGESETVDVPAFMKLHTVPASVSSNYCWHFDQKRRSGIPSSGIAKK